MSLSFDIKNRNDNELSTIFNQFISNNNFCLHRAVNQISHKCYEASWQIKQLKIKSNGYGRTESEANKHVLRNIYDIIIQYQSYSKYFYRRFNHKNSQFIYEQSSNATNKTDITKLNSKIYHEYEGQEKENLMEAKKKHSYLLFKLNQINQQNNKIKSVIEQKQLNTNYLVIKINELQHQKIKQTQVSKVKIPKLKLNTLPNYDKVCKFINKDLLEEYDQNNGILINFQL